MMVSLSSTILFYFHSFMNCIPTLFFTIATMIPAIQKLKARMRVLNQSNLLFGCIFMELNTWTTA